MNYTKCISMAALAAMCAGVAVADDGGCPISARTRKHENTEWSIMYGFHYSDKQKTLPRVLLVGDSICNGYKDGVQKNLEGKVNVTYWVSSYSLTSPIYMPLFTCWLEETTYDVIHFNNGLHSLGADEAKWSARLREALMLIRAKQPKAKIIWTPSTPLKDAEPTKKVVALNAAAAKVVAEFPDITTDDLFALMDPLDREKNWSDRYHHKAEAKAMEAKQVADAVLKALGK